MSAEYPYDRRFSPPFPAAEVILRHPDSGRQTGRLPALLDTGADGTLVPSELLWQIRAPVVAEARIRSHWGEPRAVQLFSVDMEIGAAWLPAVLVVSDDVGLDVVLGRNVLAKLKLVMDGVRQFTQISVL